MGDIVTTFPLIEGVQITPLKQICDQRGAVMHMLRGAQLSCIQEVYCSLVKSRAIKAWKRHHRMIQHYAVPVGKINLVLFDDRPNSSTHNMIQEIMTGVDCYGLIEIPSMIWYGFMGLDDGDSLIINGASLEHDPDEIDHLDQNTRQVPYMWDKS